MYHILEDLAWMQLASSCQQVMGVHNRAHHNLLVERCALLGTDIRCLTHMWGHGLSCRKHFCPYSAQMPVKYRLHSVTLPALPRQQKLMGPS